MYNGSTEACVYHNHQTGRLATSFLSAGEGDGEGAATGMWSLRLTEAELESMRGSSFSSSRSSEVETLTQDHRSREAKKAEATLAPNQLAMPFKVPEDQHHVLWFSIPQFDVSFSDSQKEIERNSS